MSEEKEPSEVVLDAPKPSRVIVGHVTRRAAPAPLAIESVDFEESTEYRVRWRGEYLLTTYLERPDMDNFADGSTLVQRTVLRSPWSPVQPEEASREQ